MPARHRVALLAMLALIASLPAGGGAQTPEASPAPIVLPEGPLGEQIAWLLDGLNAAGFDETGVAGHVAPALLGRASPAQLALTLNQIAGIGPFAIEPGTMVIAPGTPPVNASLTLAGQGGVRLAMSIGVDPASGLIASLLFEPAHPRPQVTPVGILLEPTP